MKFLCLNGNFLNEDEAIFKSSNRGFRYGDGVFETMKFYHGKLLLRSFHFERLWLGIRMLGMENSLDAEKLNTECAALCEKNDCASLARVRLAVYRNEDNRTEYLIETVVLTEEVNQWYEKGLTLGFYPFCRKAQDGFANLKTANFLPYLMAGQYAKERGWDDAVVINANNLVCDTSKANIFLISENQIHTPALHQGCVSGVMRRFLIDELKRREYVVTQNEITEETLLQADEIFLTNSIYDLRWVRSFKEKEYSSRQTFSIYQEIIKDYRERIE
jgi:branched-chain amino acid aminotransferase